MSVTRIFKRGKEKAGELFRMKNNTGDVKWVTFDVYDARMKALFKKAQAKVLKNNTDIPNVAQG